MSLYQKRRLGGLIACYLGPLLFIICLQQTVVNAGIAFAVMYTSAFCLHRIVGRMELPPISAEDRSITRLAIACILIGMGLCTALLKLVADLFSGSSLSPLGTVFELSSFGLLGLTFGVLTFLAISLGKYE